MIPACHPWNRGHSRLPVPQGLPFGRRLRSGEWYRVPVAERTKDPQHGVFPRNVASRKGGTGVNTHRHRTSLVQFQLVTRNVFVQASQRSLIARFQSIVTRPGCCVIGLAPLGDPLGEGFLLLLIGFNFFLGPAMGFGKTAGFPPLEREVPVDHWVVEKMAIIR